MCNLKTMECPSELLILSDRNLLIRIFRYCDPNTVSSCFPLCNVFFNTRKGHHYPLFLKANSIPVLPALNQTDPTLNLPENCYSRPRKTRNLHWENGSFKLNHTALLRCLFNDTGGRTRVMQLKLVILKRAILILGCEKCRIQKWLLTIGTAS